MPLVGRARGCDEQGRAGHDDGEYVFHSIEFRGPLYTRTIRRGERCIFRYVIPRSRIGSAFRLESIRKPPKHGLRDRMPTVEWHEFNVRTG